MDFFYSPLQKNSAPENARNFMRESEVAISPQPQRALVDLGTFRLSRTLATRPPHALVPVAGLLLCLLTLSLGEKVSEQIAAWRYAPNRGEYFSTYKLKTDLMALTDTVGHEIVTIIERVATVDIKTSLEREESLQVELRRYGADATKTKQLAEAVGQAAFVTGSITFGQILEASKVSRNNLGYLALDLTTRSEESLFLIHKDVSSLAYAAAKGIINPIFSLQEKMAVAHEDLLYFRKNGKVFLNASVAGANLAALGGLQTMDSVLRESPIAMTALVVLPINGTLETLSLISTEVESADEALRASAEYSVGAAALSLSGGTDVLVKIWYGVPRLVLGKAEAWPEYIRAKVAAIIDNWKDFLSGGNNSVPVKAVPTINGDQLLDEAALREEIRQEIINELEQEFSGVFDRLRAGEPTILKAPTAGEQGVVIVPEGATAEDNTSIKTRLQGMFSDPVNVRFDTDGRSGVITPQFRDRAGSNYIFLLTPVRE